MICFSFFSAMFDLECSSCLIVMRCNRKVDMMQVLWRNHRSLQSPSYAASSSAISFHRCHFAIFKFYLYSARSHLLEAKYFLAHLSQFKYSGSVTDKVE
jgi:hypothetical protein